MMRRPIPPRHEVDTSILDELVEWGACPECKMSTYVPPWLKRYYTEYYVWGGGEFHTYCPWCNGIVYECRNDYQWAHNVISGKSLEAYASWLVQVLLYRIQFSFSDTSSSSHRLFRNSNLLHERIKRLWTAVNWLGRVKNL